MENNDDGALPLAAGSSGSNAGLVVASVAVLGTAILYWRLQAKISTQPPNLVNGEPRTDDPVDHTGEPEKKPARPKERRKRNKDATSKKLLKDPQKLDRTLASLQPPHSPLSAAGSYSSEPLSPFSPFSGSVPEDNDGSDSASTHSLSPSKRKLHSYCDRAMQTELSTRPLFSNHRNSSSDTPSSPNSHTSSGSTVLGNVHSCKKPLRFRSKSPVVPGAVHNVITSNILTSSPSTSPSRNLLGADDIPHSVERASPPGSDAGSSPLPRKKRAQRDSLELAIAKNLELQTQILQRQAQVGNLAVELAKSQDMVKKLRASSSAPHFHQLNPHSPPSGSPASPAAPPLPSNLDHPRAQSPPNNAPHGLWNPMLFPTIPNGPGLSLSPSSSAPIQMVSPISPTLPYPMSPPGSIQVPQPPYYSPDLSPHYYEGATSPSSYPGYLMYHNAFTMVQNPMHTDQHHVMQQMSQSSSQSQSRRRHGNGSGHTTERGRKMERKDSPKVQNVAPRFNNKGANGTSRQKRPQNLTSPNSPQEHDIPTGSSSESSSLSNPTSSSSSTRSSFCDDVFDDAYIHETQLGEEYVLAAAAGGGVSHECDSGSKINYTLASSILRRPEAFETGCESNVGGDQDPDLMVKMPERRAHDEILEALVADAALREANASQPRVMTVDSEHSSGVAVEIAEGGKEDLDTDITWPSIYPVPPPLVYSRSSSSVSKSDKEKAWELALSFPPRPETITQATVIEVEEQSIDNVDVCVRENDKEDFFDYDNEDPSISTSTGEDSIPSTSSCNSVGSKMKESVSSENSGLHGRCQVVEEGKGEKIQCEERLEPGQLVSEDGGDPISVTSSNPVTLAPASVMSMDTTTVLHTEEKNESAITTSAALDGDKHTLSLSSVPPRAMTVSTTPKDVDSTPRLD